MNRSPTDPFASGHFDFTESSSAKAVPSGWRTFPRDRWLRWFIGLTTASAVLTVAVDLGGWFRTATVATFVLVCPGLSWSRHLRIRDLSDALAVGVAMSIALVALTAELLALASWWHPGVELGVLVALTMGGLGLPVRSEVRQEDQTRT